MNSQRPGSRCFVPCTEEGVPELWEEEEINYQLSNCEISFDATTGAVGSGKLYITSKRLIWIGDNVDLAYDYDIAYIVLHAVSRDVDSYPKPCVYCQLDIEEPYEQPEEEDEDEEKSEVFLVPAQEEDIMPLFDALSHAALLNPDPEEEGDEVDGDFIYNDEEVTQGADQARILDHLESVFFVPDNLEVNDGQFDDEEDSEEGPSE